MAFFQKVISLLLPNPSDTIIKTTKVPMKNIKKIVCFSNTAIGDTIFNTPVFRILKKNFPDKELVVLMNPRNYQLFETNPYIDKIILYNGKSKNFLSALTQLKKEKPELILILHSNEPQATPLAVLSGAKYIFKLPNENNPFSKWHSNPIIANNYFRNAITTRLLFLNFLDISPPLCARTEIFLKKEWEIEALKKLPPFKKLIGFQIGASTISRQWLMERWIELGKKILVSYPEVSIILTGSSNEKEKADKIMEHLRNKRVFNLTGELSLGGASALISKLNLLITPDTGPLHIAASLGVPTIALFAVANHKGTNPCFDRDIHLYIQKNKVCSPCVSKKCKYPKCMLQITADEVMEKIKGVL